MQEAGGQFHLWFTMIYLSCWLAFLLLYVHVAEPLPCYLLADIGIARLQRSCSLHSSAAKIFQLDDALCRAIHQRTDLVVVSWYASYEWNSSAVFLVHVLPESICSNLFCFSQQWNLSHEKVISQMHLSSSRSCVKQKVHLDFHVLASMNSLKCLKVHNNIITYTIRSALDDGIDWPSAKHRSTSLVFHDP